LTARLARGGATNEFEPTFQALARLEPTVAESEQLRVAQGALRPTGAWPEKGPRLVLEYLAPDGRVVAGEWLAPGGARRGRRSRTSAVLLDSAPTGLVLQPHGIDPALPCLAPLLQQPGATVVRHRLRRNATVRLFTPEGTGFAKVVRPRLERTVAEAQARARRLGTDAFIVPGLLQLDALPGGVLVTEGIDGTALLDILRSEAAVPAVHALAAAARALHRAPIPAGAPEHPPVMEGQGLWRRIRRLERLRPSFAAAARVSAAAIVPRLAELDGPRAPIHRDLSGNNTLLVQDRVALLDWDSLAVGDPALDVGSVVGNIAVADLASRAQSGTRPLAPATELAAAFLEAYGADADVRERASIYADARRLKTACSLAWLPGQEPLAERLLASEQ
jgi:Phosphotransferase enzyme family